MRQIYETIDRQSYQWTVVLVAGVGFFLDGYTVGLITLLQRRPSHGMTCLVRGMVADSTTALRKQYCPTYDLIRLLER